MPRVFISEGGQGFIKAGGGSQGVTEGGEGDYNKTDTIGPLTQGAVLMQAFLRQVYAEASRILKHQLEGLCETMNPAVQELPSTKVTSLQPPSMADIAEVTLSDKSDREDDC